MERTDERQQTALTVIDAQFDESRTPTPSGEWKPLPVVASRYVLLKRLGTGSSGIVYQAYDKHARGPFVALKIWPNSRHVVDRSDERRFAREVAAMQEWQHPCLVEMRDFGETESGERYVAMELVDGGTLDRHNRQCAIPFDLSEMLFVLRDVAAGMAFAHAHGILHRHLKPSSILLHRRCRAKVAGLLRPPRQAMTDSPRAADYAAPERLRAVKEIDGRADIYSLGIIAYEMAAGKRPFRGDDDDEVVTAQLNHPMPRLYWKGGPIPRWYETLVFACTEKRPRDRFQTMDEVVAYLDRRMQRMGILSDKPVKESFLASMIGKLLGA